MRNAKKRMGYFCLHTVIFLTVAAVVLQGIVTVRPLLLFAGWAELLSDEPYGAQPTLSVPEQTEMAAKGENGAVQLTLALQDIASLPHCRVLVNGQEAGCFEERQVSLALAAGDLIEVDTTWYDFPVAFEIVNGAENLLGLNAASPLCVQRGIGWLGKIRE